MNPNAVAQLDTAIADITRQFQNLTSQMQSLSSSLQRLATAGFTATTEGNRLSYVWTLFTRQIASAMLPVINMLIDSLMAMTRWLKELNGDQQRVLATIISLTVAFALFTPMLALVLKILTPFNLLIGVLGSVIYAFFTKSATGQAIMEGLAGEAVKLGNVLDGLANVFAVLTDSIAVAIDSVIGTFVGLGVAVMDFLTSIVEYIPFMGDAAAKMREWTDAGQKQLDLLAKSASREIGKRDKPEAGATKRSDVNPSGFGFESLSASYERITGAANKTDLARESLDVQKKQLLVLSAIQEGVTKPVETGTSSGGDY